MEIADAGATVVSCRARTSKHDRGSVVEPDDDAFMA